MTRAHRWVGRAVLACHDSLALLIVGALASCAFAGPAYAYVDPSVMTYTIQALAGVAVALSAVAGVAFRRTRRALLKALHIDENAHKQVEADVHRVVDGRPVDAGDSVAAQGGPAADSRGAAPAGTSVAGAESAPAWSRRLAVAFTICAFASFTLWVVAPYELVAGNASSLLFGLDAVWAPLAVAACALAAALALALSALRGTAFRVAALVVFSFGLGCYLQAMFMNPGLPAGDGHLVDWTDFAGIGAVSLAVWAAVFAVPQVAARRHGRAALGGAVAAALALIVVQGVGVASLFAGLDRAPDGAPTADQYIMTEDGLFTVSPERNAIVFVLDTYDTVDLAEALEQDPALLAEMTGFTWFRDSAPSMDPTRYGAPFLQTGTYPRAGEDLEVFLRERFERSSYLADIHEAGFSLGMYTDTIGDYLMPEQERRQSIYDFTMNIKPPSTDASAVDVGGLLVQMARCALYRDLPWVAKPPFWFTTDEVNRGIASQDAALGTSTPYVMDDAEWYAKLKERRLAADDDAAGAYRFIHLLGTHVPYEIDENGEYVGMWESDRVTQARGSMHMVAEYLAQLKQIGAYDASTIVVTADHGEWFDKVYRDDWDIPTSPILLVKPAAAPDAPLAESTAQVTAYDVIPTIIKAVTGDASVYGPTVFEQPAEGRERYCLHTICYDNEDLEILEYRIVGDVLDPASWQATGTTWDPSGVPRSN